jgi:hypothetical protein
MNSILTGITLVRVGGTSVECNTDGIICESVGAVCELEWVQGVWDDGVDVSHDQPFKAFHGYRCKGYEVTVAFLGTGNMVVCLKHVGVTD